MVLVDSSAWIEFLRDTGSVVCSRVDEMLAADLAVCAVPNVPTKRATQCAS